MKVCSGPKKYGSRPKKIIDRFGKVFETGPCKCVKDKDDSVVGGIASTCVMRGCK